jgi:hypothetical protein
MRNLRDVHILDRRLLIGDDVVFRVSHIRSGAKYDRCSGEAGSEYFIFFDQKAVKKRVM